LIREISSPATGSAAPVFDRRLKEERDWWIARLTPLPRPVGPASFGAASGAGRAPLGAGVEIELPAALAGELRRLTNDSPFLLHAAFTAAVAACLSRLSGERAVCLGSPALAAAEMPVRPNALAVVVAVDPARSFRELLLAVREELLAVYARQSYPLDRLLEDLRVRPEDGRCPLFDVAVGSSAAHTALPAAGQALTLWLDRSAGKPCVRAAFDPWRHRAADAVRFVQQVFQLLAAALRDPAAPVADLDLLTAAERHSVLTEWNDTERPLPGLPVHHLFAEQAARHPGAPALICEDRAFTYGELAACVRRLAAVLRAEGVGPEVPVAILADRSAETILAFLAVLWAGGAYVPLDPAAPPERLAFTLTDTEAPLLLARRCHRLPTPSPRVLELDAFLSAAPPVSLSVPPSVSVPSALAYVIYTSGSTGLPKGVAIEHCQLAHYVRGVVHRLGLAASASFALASTPAADLGNTVIFPALTTGGCLHVITEEVAAAAEAFAEYCERNRIDCLKIVPSHLAALLAAERPERVLPRRHLVLGGEVARPAGIARLQALAPACRIFNHYGPTETTVGVITHAVEPADPRGPAGAAPPLGRPLPGSRIYIADRGGRALPAGAPGELLIGGGGIARGYLRRAGLTAERFVPDPFSSGPGERLYRSGDLARFRTDGTIEFLGRIDRQVKIRGFRVEPGEIEAVLESHPEIHGAAVVAREHPAGGLHLVAYIVAAGAAAPGAGALRDFLLERLPEPLIPAVFLPLAALPLNHNGKVDRRALPEPETARPGLGVAWVEPRTATETAVARLWAGLLGVAQIGASDHFFSLGGHSLLATQLVARVRRVFRVELPLARVFERPTVEGMAGEIAALRGSAEVAEEIARLYLSPGGAADSAELPDADHLSRFEEILRARGLDLPCAREIPRSAGGGSAPLSFTQERIWFQDQVEKGGVAYNLMTAVRLRGPLDPAAVSRSADEIVRRHEALRTFFSVEQGVPVQMVAPPRRGWVRWVDLGGLAERDAEVRRLAAAEVHRPFDLTSGPLVRLTAVRLGAEEHVLVLTVHHIVSDGWSLGVFVRELAALYPAFLAGRPSPLPELPLQYGDFARWQREWLTGEILAAQLGYWRDRLAGSPRLLRLPVDHPRAPVQSSRGATRAWRLPAAATGSLRAFCRGEGLTLFMGLLSAFKALLRAVSGQDDIVVGTDVANRGRRELEGLVGFFVNSLVLRTDLGGDPTFRELAGRVRETTLGAYAHQDLPFSRLVEELRPERDPSHNPFFQAVLSLHNFPRRPQESAGLVLTPFSVHGGAAKFDLTLFVSEGGDELQGLLEYNTDLFDEPTIDRLLEQYRTVLDAMAAGPDRRLSSLSLASGEHIRGAIDDFNEDLEVF